MLTDLSNTIIIFLILFMRSLKAFIQIFSMIFDCIPKNKNQYLYITLGGSLTDLSDQKIFV